MPVTVPSLFSRLIGSSQLIGSEIAAEAILLVQRVKSELASSLRIPSFYMDGQGVRGSQLAFPDTAGYQTLLDTPAGFPEE